MRIGELSARTGVSPDTVRYYEKVGLLSAPGRTSGGFREYGPDAIDDIRFIKKAQTLGLKLGEIGEIVEIAAGGRAPCDHVRATIEARLQDVERRMTELRALRRTLKQTLDRLDRQPSNRGCRCAVIESL